MSWLHLIFNYVQQLALVQFHAPPSSSCIELGGPVELLIPFSIKIIFIIGLIFHILARLIQLSQILTTRGLVVPLINDPILWDRLRQSFRHLKFHNYPYFSQLVPILTIRGVVAPLTNDPIRDVQYKLFGSNQYLMDQNRSLFILY